MGFIEKSKLLIWRVFPPESQVEVFLRTIYHRFTATDFYINWQIKSSRKSYKAWLENNQTIHSEMENLSQFPVVTFIVSINSENYDLLPVTINSIKYQQVSHWNILLTYTSGKIANKDYQTIVENDSRIMEVEQTEVNLSLLISLCKTEYFALCNAGDEFFPSFLNHFNRKNNEIPDAAVYYSDMESISDIDVNARPFFKPDQLSPELLLSTNYLSRSIINKKYATQFLDEIEASQDFFDQEWNLLILLTKQSRSVIHIPNLLFRLCDTGYISEKEETRSRFFHRFSNSKYLLNNPLVDINLYPDVSIIIPTRNNFQTIKTLMESIFELTQYPNFEIILVDNGSSDKNVISYYQELAKIKNIKIIKYESPFNYSHAVNLGAKYSTSQLLLFLNNDMKVINHDWLTEMVKWATIPDVGIVGTKLLHPNHSIQHAGIIMGLQGIVGHINLNLPEHFYGFTGSVDWTRNYCAVTGACQMMRRDIFNELCGYDENFQLVLSDIDICVRAIDHGYRIVYAPLAALIHFEGQSRGYKTPLQDILLGYKKMQKWLEKDDPYYSPNLTYTPIPKCQFEIDSVHNRLTRINIRKQAIERVMKL